jgi:hypothetical protein
MGDFRVIIDAVGGHGQDRSKKDGEVVNFKADGELSPEALAQEFVEKLKSSGCSVQSAKVIHWPADNYPDSSSGRVAGEEIVDDLLTGVRKNNF